MLLAARWLLCCVLCLVLVSATLRGHWKRTPAFLGYSAAALLALATHIRLEQWFGASWLSWNSALAGCRILVTFECCWLLTRHAKRDRWPIIGASATLAAAIGILCWSVNDPSIYRLFASAAGQLSSLMLLVVTAVMGLLWRYEIPVPEWETGHSVCWMLLLANHIWTNSVRPLTGFEWRVDHAIYLGVATGCYVWWLWLFLSSGSADVSECGGTGQRPLMPLH